MGLIKPLTHLAVGTPWLRFELDIVLILAVGASAFGIPTDSPATERRGQVQGGERDQ